ncbi:pentatricopeptide repeat-containing protein [Nicotiana attenuata]|uniref:Pentatricopeptide repeat-containing protein n=1 Tax=Nicotiana attenuata TaxID=49451 RepID=A0A314KYM8_NICAT|nr:pentatricopeptide repeat-containing protein [Nicotiana attenuata]
MDMHVFQLSSGDDGYLVFSKSWERNRMTADGFRPNQVTFLAFLFACNYGGKEYFSPMMRDYGLRPRGKHYAAIVDLLGRCLKIMRGS